MVPFVLRLSPRQPGYVITVCAETRVERRERSVAEIDSNRDEVSIVMMGAVEGGTDTIDLVYSKRPNDAVRSLLKSKKVKLARATAVALQAVRIDYREKRGEQRKGFNRSCM